MYLPHVPRPRRVRHAVTMRMRRLKPVHNHLMRDTYRQIARVRRAAWKTPPCTAEVHPCHSC